MRSQRICVSDSPIFLLSICFIEDVIAEGDKVATRYTNHGTHQQELMGIPPTGKQVTVRGIVITRFADGKAVEVWNNADDLAWCNGLALLLQGDKIW